MSDSTPGTGSLGAGEPAGKTKKKKPELNEAQRKYRRRQKFLRTGQALMVIGALIAITHWLAHLEAFGPGQPPGWLDLVAGYPTGAVFIVVGSILASKKLAARAAAPCLHALGRMRRRATRRRPVSAFPRGCGSPSASCSSSHWPWRR